MHQYTIAFNFVVQSSSQGMQASLSLKGDSAQFVISDSKNVEIQPYSTSATPQLTSLSVYNNRISFGCASNTSGDTQSLKIIVPVSTSGSTLQGELPFPSMDVQVSYQFIGYSARGNIDTGSFSIPFPT